MKLMSTLLEAHQKKANEYLSKVFQSRRGKQ